ncbi:ABC transporter ATP-binding protein [Hymenobacter rubripertinctus]|uniref:ATP-binding cassette domain-containing protein n=1 Tax=Hymenobacter rubripertinctus TaxID=2029981 RepID=A0A418R409_9BACT|nr:ATP-binding cassette domain-containing protein [Hymenobacter rubripertinctus]RIY12126.1 ATP-binding cassette domain-containing protein [Hymenobacter rubripertinctus]
MIQINKFRKTYNGRVALQIDAFTIPPGIYWVRGINGSGKSTLLKALAGIAHFQGDIILAGNLNSKQQSVAYRGAVNFAEAEPVFPEFLTGNELIHLFKKAKNAPDRQEDFYVDSMSMASYLPDPVGTYSSGMLKKLSLVLAFLGQPACILLDEPLTTLDTDSLPVVYSWIARRHHQHQTTFLLSSHQEFEGETLPDVRKIVVEQGTIRYEP